MTINWKSGVNGLFETAADWTGGVVPGASDDVLLSVAGTYAVTMDQSETVNSLRLNARGATFAEGGSGVTLTVATTLSVSSGTLALATDNSNSTATITGGTLTTATGGVLAVTLGQSSGSGLSNFEIDSTVSLEGNTTISGGDLILTGGGSLTGSVSGTGELDLDRQAYTTKVSAFSGLATLGIDGGTLNLTATSGTLAPYVFLANSGTLDIASGTAITLAAAAIGPFGALDEPSENQISGAGTLVTTGNTTSTGFEVGDAGFQTDDLIIGGGLTWLNQGTVTDDGIIAMNTSSSDTVTILNAAGATFDFEGLDGGLIDHGSTGADIISNQGTLEKTDGGLASDGAGVVTIAAAVINLGLMDVQGGTLALTGGGAIGGTLSGAGTLLLYSGSYTVNGLTGTGHLSVGAGATVTYTGGTIAAAYTLDNNQTLAIASGTTQTLSGPVTIGDSSGGGTISGSGTLVTSGATTINDLSGTQALALNAGLVWTNSGTVSEAGLVGSQGAAVTNSGTFDFTSDSATFTGGGSTDTFRNAGTLGKTGGTGTSLLSDTVTSTGTIDVATGALVLGGGGAVSGVLTGAGALHLSNGSFTTTGLSGSGNLVIDNLVGTGYGTLTASATSTITAGVRLDGYAVLGAAAGKILTLTGPVAINTMESTPSPDGGFFSGPGTITTTGATTIGTVTNGSNNPALTLEGGITWINSATGTVTDSGIGSSNNGTIRNAGVFNFAADAGGIAAASSADVFISTGTLGKTGGTGTSLLTDVVTSTGTIDVATGALVLGGGGAVSGVLTGAGTLHLSNGSFTTTGLSGSGNLVIDNLVGTGYGTLTASATSTITAGVRLDGYAVLGAAAGKILTLTGPVAINTMESTPSPDGGFFSGPGTITTTGATTIGTVTNGSNNPALTLEGGITWINSATGTVTDSGIGSSNNGTIRNAGVFNFAADAGGIAAASSADVFISTGTLGKTGGTGTSLLTDVVTSTGTIDVATGALVLGGGGAVSGVLTGAGALHLSNGSFTTTGLSGSGNLVIDNLVGTGYGTLTASTTSTITAGVRLDGYAVLGAAAGKILTLTGPVAINTMESTPSPDGGFFSGPGTITTTGATTIGTVTNGSNNPALTLEGGITWINSATGTVTDSGIGSSNNGTIRNAGVFNFAADAGGIAAASNADVFISTGTLGKTGGTGTSLLTDVVTSTGTIDVATGALVLGGGGAVSGVLTGAGTLHLSNGSFTTTGLSGSGNLVIDNLVGTGYGTLTASTTSTITTAVRIDGSAALGVAAGDTLTLLNQLTINTVESTPSPDGGTLTGAGTLITDDLVTIGAITNGSNNPALTLSGGLVWSNPSTVHDSGSIASNNATIVNSGSFDFTADTGAITGASVADVFLNSGTLAKTGGRGTSAITAEAVTNTGVIEAAAGTLAVAGAIAGTGSLHIDAGATLDIATIFAGQSVTFTGAAGATLRLETPASAGLTGFGAGDRLNLVGTVSAASITGTTLTVTTGGGTFTYVSAGLAGDVAAISADFNNGSFVSIYRAATAAHSPEPLAFGNHHVGDTTGTKLALTVSNTDVADGYSEKLNATLGSATAGFTASGTANGIVAGASNSTSLTVMLDTSTAGARTGTAKLILATSGAGVDGRAATPLPGQTVNLTGAVYAYAAAHLASTSITLGNQHAGSAATTFLALGNSAATGGYSESLDASFTGGTGNATGSGSVTGIAAGATSTAALGVGLTASAGGVATGTETLTFVSDGAGTSGLGTTSLGTQAVSLTGTFYNLAAGRLAATTIAFGNHHVGDIVAARALSLTNGAATGGFSESLDAAFGAASAGIAASGSVMGLAAGAANTTALLITDRAATAGALNASVVLGLTSDGAGSSGLGTTVLAGQTIIVTGANYALASAALASATINLGIIHAGTAATGMLALANTAATGGYSESLDAGLSGASAGLSTAGSVTGLRAGAADVSTLQLTVNTATTGAYSGNATLGLVSDGAGTSGLGTTALGSQIVTVNATVDNYALAAFTDPSGPAITGGSTSATINLGSVLQGSAALSVHLGAENAAMGTADLLIGTISTAGAAGFTDTGFGSLGAALSAGQSEIAQTISLATTTAGTFTEAVLLSTAGTNASGYNGALATETLTITGTITPSTFTTYTLALGPNEITGAGGKGDVFIAASGALNSRDQLTGGNGANSITLSGAGLFDVNAPVTLANIPTINAHEGQAASGTHGNTSQTVLMRDGATEMLNVAAGTPISGDASPETIAIYGGTGRETIKLSTGADHVVLGTGTDTITLGGVANTVTAGGGTATIHATAALASASIVGTTSGSTTLALSTGGTATLNAADTHLTVQLSGAGMLRLDTLSFITAIGGAGADTLVAGGAGQTLTGGLGADTLIGAVAGGDMFADTAAGLNRDTIGNWATGDQIDIRDIANATASYAAGTLTIGGGPVTAITIAGSYSQSNFVVIGSDGAGGTLIGFHP